MPSAESVIHSISGFARSNMPRCYHSDCDPDNQAKAHGTNGTHLERRALENVQAEESEHRCDRRCQTYGEHDRPTAPHGDPDAGKTVCEPDRKLNHRTKGTASPAAATAAGPPNSALPPDTIVRRPNATATPAATLNDQLEDGCTVMV
jgi:hypothetical protein